MQCNCYQSINQTTCSERGRDRLLRVGDFPVDCVCEWWLQQGRNRKRPTGVSHPDIRCAALRGEERDREARRYLGRGRQGEEKKRKDRRVKKAVGETERDSKRLRQRETSREKER